ncbi:PNK3P-domain-containing protein [Coccomyxa subellipsoidea C-169]|uniref:PNK3P-domain-containing protein n=1 Tax=Coccomyxa subellipsoidea (strain C-169) TaxID=574566 RepID=I0Z1S5_COCSC|nr:PNK3P-domain-containing protein [Coccomyxa subellipsoidea C-169]EIE24594.1 PNK3P-domain-containing protein [Coccomyxa subellipsoidea C-169]|eukprot:XP_005649138.1 PNK3P-domain-containing protein [Coccomyxa subellipsoidea C-169]
MPPRKKRASVAEADDADDAYDPQKKNKAGSDDGDDQKPKKKPRAKKEKEPEEVHTALEGPAWTVVPPSLLYREGGPKSGEKIAAFDLDGTLVLTKSNQPYVTSPDDFKLFNKEVPKVLNEYAEKGYKIVVFSNQAGIGKSLDGKMSVKLRQRAENILTKLDVEATVLYAAGKEDSFRKPGTGMWEYFVEHLNGGVSPDKAQSFFVGDMAGRSIDIQESDSDKEGAAKKQAALPKAGQEGENHNAELSAAFEQLADHFTKRGEGFKARALDKSGKIIAAHSSKVTSSKDLKGTAGIGKGSMGYIDEFLETGTIAALDEAGGFQNPAAKGDAKPSEEQTMALKFL